MSYTPSKTPAQAGAQRGLVQVAQRCGVNGVQGVTGGSNPYLASWSRHLCPGGADAIQLVYGGFQQLGSTPTETSIGPNIFSASGVTLSGGSGYVAGEIMTFALTTSTGIKAAKVMVTSVSSGVPGTWQVIDGGAYVTMPGSGVSQASTTGSGTGATATFTWQAYAVAGQVGIEPIFGNQAFTGPGSVKAAYKGIKADSLRNNALLVPMGDFLVTDLIEVDVPVGGAIGLRATFGGPGTPLGRLPMTSGYGYTSNLEEAYKNATNFDQSLSGTISPGSSTCHHQPLAILGIPKKPIPTVVAMGNSREYGNATGTGCVASLYDVMDTDGNLGWLEKALSATLGNAYWPYSNMSRGGDRYSLMIPGTNPALTGRAGRMKGVAIIGPTAVYLHDAVNDYTNGITLAATLASETQMIQELKGMGVRQVFTATTDPVTASTDSWATVGNQTSSTGSASRIARNAALRAGTWAPYDFFIDHSSIIESAVGSDLWAATGTALAITGDGTHCSPAYVTLKANHAAPIIAANVVL